MKKPMIKRVVIMSAVFAALGIMPALADHHGGDGKHHGGGKMFEKADTNGDGKISKEEFMAKHEKRFDKMDANGDGSITKEEIQAKRKGMKDKRKEKHSQSEGADE